MEEPKNSKLDDRHKDFLTYDEIHDQIFLDPAVGPIVSRYTSGLNDAYQHFSSKLKNIEGTESKMDLRYKLIKSIDRGIVKVGLSVKVALAHEISGSINDIEFIRKAESTYGQIYGDLMYFLIKQKKDDPHLLNVTATRPYFEKSYSSEIDVQTGSMQAHYDSYFFGETFIKIYLAFGDFN
ncbi:hypothetical protein KC669_00850 [Candidatus Dojkabacteria bacterium]|uniref:Uncharacterized protein n=1 Tax=Candidatus Dojkabacteria bacterium TaxID=2099670 RepID=A0A955RLC5_9BACT|nr:hypothetical protein [Candidatus Dojkabacteria bacterium]